VDSGACPAEALKPARYTQSIVDGGREGGCALSQRREAADDLSKIEMKEAEPWERWETKLVAWSVGIGIVLLIVGGYLINAFILNK
jgi:hypothetical protein